MTALPTPVLVTRPSPDGEATCKALEEVGVNAVHTPLMAIQFSAVPSPLPIEKSAALAFTSANGVRAWAEATNRETDLPAFYVGPASAAAGEAAGLQTAGIAGGDVESLASLIQARAPGPVLHIRGVHAAGDLVGRLTEEGITAAALPLYEAMAAKTLPPGAAEALGGGPCTVALFSPRTATLFARLVEEAGLTPTLTQATAACLSANVANMARTLPFHEIVTAQEPHLPSFVDMVKAGCP